MFIETVYAINNNWAIFENTMEFWDFILLFISLFVLASGLLSIIFILWWGLLLILSWGKDDKIKPAVNTIRYAVIWIIVTVFTIFIFPVLWRLLWLDVERYAKPEKIFEKIEDLGDKVFWKDNINSNIQDLDSIPSDFSDL
jgi:H+/Cl- antiporter ClcA